MLRTYKYRLYPTNKQKRILNQTLDVCRYLYNDSLAERKSAWECDKKSISYNDQAAELTQRKKVNSYPALKQVHSQVLQDVLRRVDKAFQNFFRRVKNGEEPGYPRFKSENRYDSFTYPQSGFELNGNHLFLSKIGSIKVKLHREIPKNAVIKTCTIEREVDLWYVCFSVELKLPAASTKEIKAAVGIDMGLNHMMTLSNGEVIDNPRHLKKTEKKLAKHQRRLSRKKRGSKNRGKQKKKVAHIHKQIVNQRKDMHHKLSRMLVNNYDLIVFEDLKVKNMVKNPHLAKSISDAGWEQLTRFTSYKAEEAGSVVVEVNPDGTSQECCVCKHKEHLTLAQRTFRCSNCGNEMDRDVNAAINILNRGLENNEITAGTAGRAAA